MLKYSYSSALAMQLLHKPINMLKSASYYVFSVDIYFVL